MIHYFNNDISHIKLPDLFTFPFHYTPHPLCLMAAQEVEYYIQQQELWQNELNKGKMFGVLIVRTQENRVGYLSAYSGNLCHSNSHDWFVPAIYNLLNPEGYFVAEENNISAINKRIREIISSDNYKNVVELIQSTQADNTTQLVAARVVLKEAKKLREEKRRTECLSQIEIDCLTKESQFLKAQFKRLERQLAERLDSYNKQLLLYTQVIGQLKTARRQRSAALQRWLFAQFRMLNGNGEKKDLNDIFIEYGRPFPPAGAGECAGPKLLQYAYANKLQPLAMAEFWWGNSPKSEIRHHKHFYPACSGKCEPILNYMLKGLDIEPNPLHKTNYLSNLLQTIYEDEWIVIVNKPAGMLSVPGKSDGESVYSIISSRFPEADGPLLVHRLDMATSGLLLIAKSKRVHKALQDMFRQHTIQKCYHAILDGMITTDKGVIKLPLCLDPMNRPRQIVDFNYGKEAITEYEVMKRIDGQTHIVFYPRTGRTHQLRVHAAHSQGLNTSILGDTLYGKSSSRLHLHAFSLKFVHPLTNKEIYVEAVDYDIL